MECESMNLDLVRTFVRTVQAGSLKEASLKTGMDVSNISRHIKSLESILQTKLLQKKHGVVSLTEDGKIIYDEYEKAYNLLFLAEKKLLQKRSVNSGKLSIGCLGNLEKTYLLEYIRKFNGRYPNVAIKVISGSSKEMYKKLEQYSIDLVLDYADIIEKDSEINTKKLFDAKYCLVYNPKFFPNNIDLANVPIIVSSSKTERNVLNKYAMDNNINFNIKYEISNSDHIIEYINKGLGVGFVLEKAVEDTNLEKIELPDIYTSEVAVSYVKNNLSESGKTFLEILK